ncbi:MAG TPA: MraY family glycosyltransferase, partial [Burkholderiaceae bacterium]|nr:MraY family glycosyltransferase [Burkholderiaceae bacterium]
MQLASLSLSFLLVIVLVPLLAHYAPRLRLMDVPDARKQHHGPVPLVGGIAILAAFTIATLALDLHSSVSTGFLAGLLMLMLLGLTDDLRPLPSLPRFAMQAFAIWVAVTASGNLLTDVGQLVSPQVLWLGSWSVVLTVFGILGVVNATNMIDGVDGLAAGIGVTALAWFVVVFALIADSGAVAGPSPLIALYALIGALLGFLVYNLRTPWRARASVFLGDAGSLALGFALGWFAVAAASLPHGHRLSPVAALWILIVPLFDTVSCMLRRAASGRSPMSADRHHAHHLLQALGQRPAAAAATLIGINAAGGAVGVIGWRFGVPDYWMFAAIAVLFAIYTVASVTAWHRLSARNEHAPAAAQLRT